jgi:hypothetical protein
LAYDLSQIDIQQGGGEMKDSRQSISFLVALIAGLVFFTSLEAVAETDGSLSAQDEDAFILYKYSLIDAKKNRSQKIAETTEGEETIYRYDGHALSCGTVMTGSITKANGLHHQGNRGKQNPRRWRF